MTRWFEKTDSVFAICNCPSLYKVKYAACTFEDHAITWWNSHVQTMGLDKDNALTWA